VTLATLARAARLLHRSAPATLAKLLRRTAQHHQMTRPAPSSPDPNDSSHSPRAWFRRGLRIAFYGAGALVAVLSLAPSAAMPSTGIGDKAGHLIAYAVLGALGAASTVRSVARAFLGLAAFGIAIEVLQTFSPGRSPDPLDVVADVVGVGLGCGAAIILRRTTSLLIDKDAAGATACPARVAGGDRRSISSTSTVASPSPDKRSSCVSD
jgi:VanZ family protein